MATPHKVVAASSTFFQKERDRIIAEVADGVEQLLGNANTLNRKLEESIAVGQEFEPISNLWGRFVGIMSSSGITPQAAAAADFDAITEANAQAQMDSEDRKGATESEEGYPLGGSTALEENLEDTLPLGVAPGGGIVYGRG